MTLTKITAGFNKTLKQLDTFITKQDKAITSRRESIMLLQNDERLLQNDKDQAIRIKKNIEGIIK